MAKKEKNNCTRVFSYENGRCHQDCYIYFIRSGFWVFFLLTIAANGKKDGDDVKGGGKVDSFSPHVNVTNCLETKRYPVSWWGERESSWPRWIWEMVCEQVFLSVVSLSVCVYLLAQMHVRIADNVFAAEICRWSFRSGWKIIRGRNDITSIPYEWSPHPG